MKNRPMTRVNLDKAIARMAGDDSCARAEGEKGKDYGEATDRCERLRAALRKLTDEV